MAISSNTTPEQIVDKNGKVTTVHRARTKPQGGVARSALAKILSPRFTRLEVPEYKPAEFKRTGEFVGMDDDAAVRRAVENVTWKYEWDSMHYNVRVIPSKSIDQNNFAIIVEHPELLDDEINSYYGDEVIDLPGNGRRATYNKAEVMVAIKDLAENYHQWSDEFNDKVDTLMAEAGGADLETVEVALGKMEHELTLSTRDDEYYFDEALKGADDAIANASGTRSVEKPHYDALTKALYKLQYHGLARNLNNLKRMQIAKYANSLGIDDGISNNSSWRSHYGESHQFVEDPWH